MTKILDAIGLAWALVAMLFYGFVMLTLAAIIGFGCVIAWMAMAEMTCWGIEARPHDTTQQIAERCQ